MDRISTAKALFAFFFFFPLPYLPRNLSERRTCGCLWRISMSSARRGLKIPGACNYRKRSDQGDDVVLEIKKPATYFPGRVAPRWPENEAWGGVRRNIEYSRWTATSVTACHQHSMDSTLYEQALPGPCRFFYGFVFRWLCIHPIFSSSSWNVYSTSEEKVLSAPWKLRTSGCGWNGMAATGVAG